MSQHKCKNLTKLVAGVLIAGAAATSAYGEAGDFTTLKHRLERVTKAYFDLMGQYPAHYACDLRSPELVASLDANARRAWGDGHVAVSRTAAGFKMSAEGLARPEAAPLFNLALGLWQLRLATELNALGAYLPAALTAVAVGVAAAPLTHEAKVDRTGDVTRFVLRARRADHGVQELRLELTAEDELRSIALRRRDGGSLDVRFSSRRSPLSQDRWLVTGVTATVEEPAKPAQVVLMELDYAAAEGGGRPVVLRRLAVRREDAQGRPVRQHAKEVNPISFELGNCRVGPAAAR